MNTEPEGRVALFDLDGTVFETGHRMNWDNPASLKTSSRPYKVAVDRIKGLLAAGHHVHFVTSRRAVLASATRQQIVAAFGDWPEGARIYIAPFDKYTPMDAVSHKYDVLRRIKADVYVGDLDEDQTAAAMTGTSFVPAHLWRSTGRLPGIWQALGSWQVPDGQNLGIADPVKKPDSWQSSGPVSEAGSSTPEVAVARIGHDETEAA